MEEPKQRHRTRPFVPLFKAHMLALCGGGLIMFLSAGMVYPPPEASIAVRTVHDLIEDLPDVPDRRTGEIFQPPVPHVLVYAKITAYCPCNICTKKTGPWNRRTTALMRPATTTDGIAVSWDRIPRMARVYVPDAGGLRVADDTGEAMRQSSQAGIVHIDVRKATHAEARAWGVRWNWIGVFR